MDDAMVREISITRIFAAPRDLVWRAWTEADQLAQWFMPHGFTVPACDMDLRPGGKFTMTVRGPDGTESPTGGEFREIDPPERLVFTTTGTPVRRSKAPRTRAPGMLRAISRPFWMLEA